MDKGKVKSAIQMLVALAMSILASRLLKVLDLPLEQEFLLAGVAFIAITLMLWGIELAFNRKWREKNKDK